MNHSMQNGVPFSFLSKNVKIKMYRTTILKVILPGCETFLSHTEGVWEQGAEILGLKRDEVAEKWRSGGDS